MSEWLRGAILSDLDMRLTVVAGGLAEGAPSRPRFRIECTLCGRRIDNGDCGTPHRSGSAQMILRGMA